MIEYIESHDCQKPDMLRETRMHEVSSGWWIFKRKDLVPEHFYETRAARWRCPQCDSVWEYEPGLFATRKGIWFCVHRVTWPARS